MNTIDIDKRSLDKALNNSDITTIKTFFKNVDSNSTIEIIKEKERFKLLENKSKSI